jgi:predicted cytidylate kinase
MRIAISGLTGVGKTTVAEIVAEKLNVAHITFSMKFMAEKMNISLIELQDLAKKDHNIDKKFDEIQLKEMERVKDFVISTWLGPWLAKPELSVWLKTDNLIRFERISKRENMSLQKAKEYVLRKDEQNMDRYMTIYNIDIAEHSMFDLELDTTELTPEQVADIIIKEYNKKR